MKKTVILFLGLILLISCDRNVYYDYFIINNNNEEIEIHLIDLDNKSFTYNISAGMIQLVYHNEGMNFLEDRMVESFIKKITITKGGTVSKINYISRNRWDFKPTSKYHANSYLTVKPEDFE